MSDPIKGAGLGNFIDTDTSAQNLGSVEGAQGTEEAFSQVLATETQSAGLEGLDPLDPSSMETEGIIKNVAARLHSGEVSGPGAALEEVMDGILDHHFSSLSPQIRGRLKRDLKNTMLDDPFFVLEVEELLQHALEML